MVKKIILTLTIFLTISCGPSDEELNKKINDEFSKLISSYPTSTPVPTATPIPFPTPVPTATPIALIDIQDDIKNLIENPSVGLDVNELYEKYRKSVVKIEHGNNVGTGWAISKDYIVTNEHVISGSGNRVKIFVPSTDGSVKSQICLLYTSDAADE